jgi:hypothetical protein
LQRIAAVDLVSADDHAVVVDRRGEKFRPRSVIFPLLHRNPWAASVLVCARPTTW